MNSAIERLLSIRVRDAMSRRVVTVSPSQTTEEAARLLVREEVSGAPVVDEFCHCVGMFTAVDLLKHHGRSGRNEPLAGQEHRKGASANGALVLDIDASEAIGARMSSAVQSVRADDTLMEAARRMCLQHVHRLPVLDEKGHVEGLISSLDIVAAMVQAVEE